MRILVLTTRFPWPLDKGDRLTCFHRIRELSERGHDVFLVSYPPTGTLEEKQCSIDVLADYCEVIIVARRAWLSVLMLPLTLWIFPAQVALFYQRTFIRVAQDVVRRHEISTAHIMLVRAGFCVNSLSIPIVLDLIDAMAWNMSQLKDIVNGPLKKIAYAWDAKRVGHFEQKILRDVFAAVVVSQQDKDQLGEPNEKIFCVPNGVDTNMFRPLKRDLNYRFTIGFSGKLDYPPNVEALLFFIKVFRRFKRVETSAELLVIGGGWDDRLNRLRTEPGVKFTGYVQSVADFLGGVDVAVAPMFSGSGIQTKVLEALSCGLPLIATPKALGGIKVIDGEHMFIAHNEDGFLDKMLYIFRNIAHSEKVGAAARDFVMEQHSWHTVGKVIAEIHYKAIRRRTEAQAF